jgi:hypothetical protein
VLGTGTTRATDNTVLYSDGQYHDPAKEPPFHNFIAEYNLRRLEEVISTLRWENFRLKERLLQ